MNTVVEPLTKRVSIEQLNRHFFGVFYRRGDHSFEGYLPNRPMFNEERTLREVDGLIRYLAMTPEDGLAILDAPCGYGRHVVELAGRGFRVNGIDLCPTFVELAKRSLERAKLPQHIVTAAALRKLPFEDCTFDVLINLFFAFGFYEKDKDNFRCLEEFARVLKPGGRLLFHTDVNVSQFANGTYRQPVLRYLVDGAILRIEEGLQGKRLVGSWTIEERAAGKTVTQTRGYSIRVYSRDEFEELCASVGLTVTAEYGSFDKQDQEYLETSDEMILIATKQ